jgi:hypothetical protein
MGLCLDLYKLKIKVFLGAVRASRASIFLVALYFVGILPGSIGMSIAVSNLVREGIDLTVHLDYLSTVTSGVVALSLISALRGYVVFEYEQNLIFTSYIMPRSFLIGSLLADITALSFFFLPLYLFLAMIIVSLALPIVSALVLVTGLLLFIFFLFLLKTSFSILVSVRTDALIKIITAIVISFLLLPGASLAIPSFPLNYGTVPYPSTLLAEALINALYGNLSVQPILGMVTFFLASLVLFAFCSSQDLFQVAKAVPLVSPFDTSMRMQTVKMGKNIRLFSRVGLRFSLGLGSESLLRFLMKKELIRMIRDGSLFAVLIFYLIVSIISLATRQAPFPVWMFILVIYSFIVPPMLIGNWRVSELDNLWIPLTSGVNLGYVAKSLLYNFVLIACIVPAGMLVIFSFLGVNPFVPLVVVLSVSLIGSSANLFTVMHFLGRKRKATPSFMIGWVSMLLSGLLSSPTYIYTALGLVLSPEISLLFGAVILVYSILVFWFFSGKIERKAAAIEI